LAFDGHLPGKDQRARPFTRRRQAFVDNELIQPNAQFLQP
jgi:hypothetical protein